MKKLLILLVLTTTLSLQAEIYNFARLDNTHGLSNNQVECVLKDSRGFVWIGTNFGLNRYDGIRIKVYKSIKNDTMSLYSNALSKIQEDAEGRIWISNQVQYIIYDTHKEQFVRNLASALAPLGIHFIPQIIEIDAQKNYYFYRERIGVYKYDVKLKKLLFFKQANDKNSLSKGLITNIKSDKGFCWVLYQTGLVERLNEKTQMVDFRNSYLAENAASSTLRKYLFIDSDGSPWVYPGLGDKGVLNYDMSQSKWVYFGNGKKDNSQPTDKIISSSFVRSITEDQKKRIWIASDHGGISIFDKKSNDITVLRNDPQNPTSLSQNSAISLYCDNEGIMWVGTYKNGVSYYHPGLFKFDKSPLFFYHNPSLENKDCNVLMEDRKGNLWIGTNGSGVLKLDATSRQFTLYRNQKENSSSISSDIITSMLEDKRGALWFGTFLGGLNQMKGSGFVRYLPDQKSSNSISNKSIYGLIEDDKENMWIATLGGGIDQLDPNRKQITHHTIDNSPGMLTNVVLSMYEKRATSVYISTPLGINVLNTESGKIKPLFKTKEQMSRLSDQIIYNTLEDSRGFVWIATDVGVNIYNPKTDSLSFLNTTNGLPSDQVVSLVEDNNHNIWVGTRNGLACIYCKRNSAGNYDYSIVSFDENDGLPSSIINQNGVFKNRQGKIYIGTTKGYVVFDPKTIHFNHLVPSPRFTDLEIGNDIIVPGVKYKGRMVLDESVVENNKIELNYDEKSFTINFSALSYIHPEKNRYRYKLKGFDEDWITTKNGVGSASYSNLFPGHYQLQVYACNNDNVWSTQPLILNIEILPPFYLTWWAFLFYFFVAIFLLWYILKFQLRKQQREFERTQRDNEAKQLHEMDEMKFRFFTNISHEFRTPLTLIISPVEKLLEEARTDEQRSLLAIIHRNAQGLLDLVNQLLDFRKLDVQKDTVNLTKGDIVGFIKDICYSFTDLANRKVINFSFSTSVSEFRMEFDQEKMRKIIFNLLSNAFKFTSNNGRIDVNISIIQNMNENSQSVKLSVSDNGIGIPPKDIDRIFDRFYRVENPANANQTGTGVGLHIVSEYIKLHEGEIRVDSRLGKGSNFTMVLPAKQHFHEEIITQNGGNVEELSSELPAEAVVEEVNTKLPLMLIVDDNEDFRNFISSMFSNNYRILKAEDGEAALKLILDKMPDLIISDVMMPKMDGFELCKRVKEDIRISHIPIILLTAKAGEENKYAGLEAGAEDYIAKPFKMEILSLKVARIIERQKKTQEHFKNKVEITTSEVEITSVDEKFVKKAVMLVEANIANPSFHVEDLGREMGMSRVYFYKKILSLTGKTPSEFIRFIRLKRASELLEKSQLYVNEIAYQVGFNDPKYFRKYFKDEFGISPNEYKKQKLDNK